MSTKSFRGQLAATVAAVLISITSMSLVIPADAAGHTSSSAWSQFVASLRGKFRGKTLNVMGENDPYIAAMKTMAARFAKLTGATVNVGDLSYNGTYQKETTLAKQKSTAYDIYIFDIPWTGQFGEGQYTVPLNKYIAQAPASVVAWKDIFKTMRQAATWKGKIVGFPFAPYFIISTFNKRDFRAAGIKKLPTTYPQVLKDAKILTHNPKLPGVYGASLNNATGSPVGQAYFEYIYNIKGGKAFASETPNCTTDNTCYANMTPQFTSPQSLAVVRFFKSMLKYEPPGSLSTAWNQRVEYFDTNKAAMIFHWDVDMPEMQNPTVSAVPVSNQGFASPPTWAGVHLTEGMGGWSMGINNLSKNKVLAWDFIEWFNAPQNDITFAHLGGFPARWSTLLDKALIRQYPWYRAVAQVVPYAFPDFRPRIPPSFAIIDTLGTYIADALDGRMTVRAAMQTAQTKIGDMLKAAGYTVH